MVKKVLGLTLIGVLGVSFSGCVGGKEVKPAVVKTQYSQTINRKLIYVDPIENSSVTQNDIIKVIMTKFNKASTIQPLKYYRCNKYSYCNVKGRKAHYKNGEITVYYIHGLGYRGGLKNRALFDINNKDAVRSMGVIKIPLELKGSANSFDLKSSFPKNMINIDYSGGMSNWEPLTTTVNMQRDAYNGFQTINNEIPIQKFAHIKNEIVLPYNKESIESTIKRHLTGGHDTSFLFHGKYYSVIYEVYPYRNGSKVEYTIIVPYTLYSNGTSSISKKDIKSLQIAFEKMIKS